MTGYNTTSFIILSYITLLLTTHDVICCDYDVTCHEFNMKLMTLRCHILENKTGIYRKAINHTIEHK